MAKRKGKIYIGTSGWHYKHWVGTFYPDNTKPKDYLAFFLQSFNTVELNNPFYHMPSKEIFEGWRKQTPKGFIFAVKGSRFITHNKKLKDTSEALSYMIENVEGLKEKLGPILFQLPPGWKVNTERLESFLKILPKGYRFTFEFRNESWYTEEVIALLKKYKAAFCIYHLAGHKSPEYVTADFVYIRLHGPGGKYQGSYSEKELQHWADKMKLWTEQGKDVYCYFDNDQAGYAAFNAQRLLELV
jgi:uncharacterized protein YecE (DUF72 family)